MYHLIEQEDEDDGEDDLTKCSACFAPLDSRMREYIKVDFG